MKLLRHPIPSLARFVAILLFSACLHHAAVAQSSDSSHLSHRELVRQIRKLAAAQEMVNMPSVAPVFMEDAQFSSTLYVVNEGNSPARGKLLLLSTDGRPILDKTVTLLGHDQAALSIQSLLAEAGSSATRGSIELFDDNVWGSALAGEVVLTFHGATDVNIDEELLMPTMSQSHELRGLAIEAAASPVISVGSTTDQPVQVTVTCTGERSKPVRSSFQIASHQTVTLRPCSSAPGPMDASGAFRFASADLGPAEARGIQILSWDPKAEIQAFGFSPVFTNGSLSFAAVPFQDPVEILSPQTIYPGVPVGNVSQLWGTYLPHVVVQNYSAQPRNITVYNARTRFGSSTYEKAASFTVGPSSVKSIPVEGQTSMSGDWNTYVVQSDGLPGDIQTQLWSEDAASQSRVLFAGKDGKDDRNTGLHPWTLQDGADDDLYLYNETQSDQSVQLKINNRFKLWEKTLLLHPNETRKISLRDLADQALADDHQTPFAIGAGEGEISWYNTTSSVRGRLEHKDERRHLVTSFQCAAYTVFCGIGPMSGPSTLALGASAQYSAYDAIACVNNEAPQLCYGVESGSFANASFYWSQTGTALSLQGSLYNAYVTAKGTSAGSTTLMLQANYDSCVFYDSQAVTVTPAIPVNFKTTQGPTLPDGTLTWTYSWQSSSGNLSDLSSCQAGETVFYPGSGNYKWPLPMVDTTINPTALYGPASNGLMQDKNGPPNSYQKPYSETSFQATQTLQWECSNYSNGNYQRFIPDLTITRSIQQNGSTWQYTITKAGASATVNLP